MQTVVYADLLVIFNTVMTLLIIVITSDFLKIDSVRIRYVSGALCGGVCSLIILAPPLNIFLMLFVRTIFCLIIVILSFGIKKPVILVRCLVAFVFVSCLLAGIVYCISGIISHSKFYTNNGYMYTDLGVSAIIAIVCVAYLVIKILNSKVFSKQKDDLIFDVQIEISHRKISIKALYDSGNNLIDIFTGKPVIVVSVDELTDVFDYEYLMLLRKLATGDVCCGVPERIRLLPVCTLGKESILPAFTADKAIVNNNNLKKIIYKPCVAVSLNCFDSKRYTGLINESVTGQVI